MILTTDLRSCCCRAFVLPFSPEKLEQEARSPSSRYMTDMVMLADMVRYVGRRMVNQITGEPYGIGGHHVYSCRHLGSDGRCRIYRWRPHVCRIYHRCEFPNHCQSSWCPAHPSNQKEEPVIEKAMKKALFDEVQETPDEERNREHAIVALERLIERKQKEIRELEEAREWLTRNCPRQGPVEHLIYRAIASYKIVDVE